MLDRHIKIFYSAEFTFSNFYFLITNIFFSYFFGLSQRAQTILILTIFTFICEKFCFS